MYVVCLCVCVVHFFAYTRTKCNITDQTFHFIYITTNGFIYRHILVGAKTQIRFLMCSVRFILAMLGTLWGACTCANFTYQSSNLTSNNSNDFSERSTTTISPKSYRQPVWRWNTLESKLTMNTKTNKESSFDKGNSLLFTRKLGVNSMLSSFIYSLTMIPLFLAISSVFTPSPYGKCSQVFLSSFILFHLFIYKCIYIRLLSLYLTGFYGRHKRALVNESHFYRHLPLMNRDETRRFLSLFETTLLVVLYIKLIDSIH